MNLWLAQQFLCDLHSKFWVHQCLQQTNKKLLKCFFWRGSSLPSPLFCNFTCISLKCPLILAVFLHILSHYLLSSPLYLSLLDPPRNSYLSIHKYILYFSFLMRSLFPLIPYSIPSLCGSVYGLQFGYHCRNSYHSRIARFPVLLSISPAVCTQY